MRLFIGIQPPEEIRRKLRSYAEKKFSGLRGKLVELENLHITLKFIGEVSDEKARKIAEAIEHLSFGRFTVELSGIFGFPTTHRARVIWVGVGKGADSLRALFSMIENLLEPLGVPREVREYTPHLTLMRLKVPADVSGLHPAFGSFEAKEVILFQSILRPTGPIYKPLVRRELI